MSFRNYAILLIILNTASNILFELTLTETSIKCPEFNKMSVQRTSLISFIIPTFLSRRSLSSAILSVKSQTVKDWRILIGIDIGYINQSVSIKDCETVLNDSRIEVVHVNSSSSDRGASGNGAGEIRYILAKDYSKSRWVGFVDDDDVIDSSYVKFLQDALNFDRSVDLVISTMRLSSGYVVPTGRHFLKRYVLKNYVGISFAVRQLLFQSSTKSLKFKKSCTEDYDFVRDAFERGYNIVISDCIAYYVRPFPRTQRVHPRPQPCNFRKLRLTYNFPPRKQHDVV
jgi:glycosyltransferase involved in cell wall biosynthesis